MDHRLLGLWSLFGHGRRDVGRFQGMWRIRGNWRSRDRLRRRRLRIEFIRQGATAAEILPAAREKEHGVQTEGPLDGSTMQETLIAPYWFMDRRAYSQACTCARETLEASEFQSFQITL